MSTIFRSSLKAIDGTRVTIALNVIDPGVDYVDSNESLALVALYELAPPESTLRRELSWDSIRDAQWAQRHVLGLITACQWEGKPRQGLLHLTLSDAAWTEGLKIGAKADSRAFVVSHQPLPSALLLPTSGQANTRPIHPEGTLWLPRELFLAYKAYTPWDLVPPVLYAPAFAPEAYTPSDEASPTPEALRFQPVWLQKLNEPQQREFGLLWQVSETHFTLVSISSSATSLSILPRSEWQLQPLSLKANSHAHRLSFEDYVRHLSPHLTGAQLEGHHVTLSLAQNETFETPHEAKALAYLLAVNDLGEHSFDFKPRPNALTAALRHLLTQHKLNWGEDLNTAVSYGAHAWISGLSYENTAPSLSVEALLALPEAERLARWREVQHRQTLRFTVQAPDLAAHLRDLPLPRPLSYIPDLAFLLPPQPAPPLDGAPDAYAFFWRLDGKTQRAMRALETHHSLALARFGSTLSEQRLKRAGYETPPEALRESFDCAAAAHAAFEARCAARSAEGYYQAPSSEACASYLAERLQLSLSPELRIEAVLDPSVASDFPVGARLQKVSGAVLSVETLSTLEELYSLVRVSEGLLYVTLLLPDTDQTERSTLTLGAPEPLPKPKKPKAK